MEATTALLADNAHTSSDGKLYILGVFDGFTAPEVPFTYRGSLYLVVRFAARLAEGTEHTVQVEMIDEDGGPVVPKTEPVPLRFALHGHGRPLAANFIGEFADLQLPVYGDYEIVVHVDGQRIVTVPLFVQEPRRSGG